jgi:FemAB-related protein (PEP-CTERM system-associated)
MLLVDIPAEWRTIIHSLPDASLAHAPEWFAVISRAYGHEPMYLMASDERGYCGVLPSFIVRRPLFGTIVASMPFLDGGGPCATAGVGLALVTELLERARQLGARLVEIRCARPLAIGTAPIESKVNMTLALPQKPDDLWKGLDKSVRNQVRKAERAGLSVEAGGAANLPAFYAALVERMRDLGSPVHALEFLRAVVAAFGPRARVVLVKKHGVPVGGLVAIAFKKRLIVPWASCLKEHFALCPNMLLYWETLRSACAEGFERFDFGRSSRGSGTYRFKRQWGAVEEPLYWYRIPVGAPVHAVAGQRADSALLMTKMWQRLPLPVTRQVGPRIRKYLVQ